MKTKAMPCIIFSFPETFGAIVVVHLPCEKITLTTIRRRRRMRGRRRSVFVNHRANYKKRIAILLQRIIIKNNLKCCQSSSMKPYNFNKIKMNFTCLISKLIL